MVKKIARITIVPQTIVIDTQVEDIDEFHARDKARREIENQLPWHWRTDYKSLTAEILDVEE